MYVCICKQVTDHQIICAIEQGATSVSQLQDQLGVSSNCGECKGCVRNLLRKNKSSVTTRCLSTLGDSFKPVPTNAINVG